MLLLFLCKVPGGVGSDNADDDDDGCKIMVLITTELVIVFPASAEYDWMTVPMTMTMTVTTMSMIIAALSLARLPVGDGGRGDGGQAGVVSGLHHGLHLRLRALPHRRAQCRIGDVLCLRQGRRHRRLLRAAMGRWSMSLSSLLLVL